MFILATNQIKSNQIKSNKSLIVGKIEFSDDNDEKFSILLSGYSDNSYLTNYPFIKRNKENDTHDFFLTKNKSVNFMNKNDTTDTLLQNNEKTKTISNKILLNNIIEKDIKVSEISQMKSSTSTEKENNKIFNKSSNCKLEIEGKTNLSYSQDENEWKSDTSKYLKIESYIILNWLNKFVCKKPFDTEQFPECILNSYGEIFVDFIEEVIKF